METVNSVNALREVILRQKQWQKKIAFVPTMGNLHQGHLELVKLAGDKADFVVASIFVNPMQFGEGEDFDKYPRTHQADIQKLIDQGCDLLFLPTVETMYPVPHDQQTRVEVPGLSDMLCGASRPGHFTGVSTVVCKLFNMVQPDIAIFGEKDYQQLMVIRRMVNELSMPIEIVGAPIVREKDGLAMSSRNGYLSKQQRELAPALNAQLHIISAELLNGSRKFKQLEKQASASLDKAGFKTDYVAIRRQSDLLEPQTDDEQLVILAAAYLGSTRLIDNLVVSQ